MAARRLLIIMVVLLTISTLAAALVPPPEERAGTGQTTSSTATTSRSKEPPTGGRLVDVEVAVRSQRERPREIDVEPGDQLSLLVTSVKPGEVSVPAFGLLEFAGPGSPARFDILIEKAGRYPVHFQGAGTVATIVAGVSREARPDAGER